MKTQIQFYKSLLILIALTCNLNANGQLYLIEDWVQSTGIPDTIDYSASKVDGSGNIYVTTNTISVTEKANILTTKYNSSGVVQWEVENDNADENDYGTAIEVDGSGNVYVGAATWVDATNKYDYIVIKYNSSGTQQWTATYNGPGNFYDIPTDIYVDGSGNVYVTGYSYGSTTLGDYCTIKYNSSGTAQWTSRYDYASDQDAAAIVRSGPGSTVVVIGASENIPGDWDFAAVQYNTSTGAQVNTNRNSASGSGFDQVYGADVDASGNIYITGRASVVDEGFNMRTVKLEPDLDLVWAKNHDHAELDDEAHGVIVDLDDNVYVSGWVTKEDQTRSMLLVKYNSAGTLQWYKQIDAPNSGLDAVGLKISSVTGGNVVIAGNVDNGQSLDFLTAIYNSDGDLLWLEQYDSPDKYDDKVNFVKADVDGVFYVGGKSYGISTATNRLIKYNSVSYIIPPDDEMEHTSSFTFFENKGQIKDTEDEIRNDIKYYTHRHNPSLYFSDDVLSYVWSRIDTNITINDTLARVDLTFTGSNTSKSIHRAVSQGGEYLNYYLPHCPDGVTNARSSDRLIISELYDYVDLEYYFDNAGLKYYLIIKPGWSEQADPISLLYDGATDVNILGGGELEVITSLGKLTHSIADAYQIDASGEFVALGWDAEFLSIDDFEIGFDIDVYDDELPLIIEMKLEGALGGADCEDNVIWGTWNGGTGDEYMMDITTGYVHPAYTKLFTTGNTRSNDFPAELLFIGELSPFRDIFIEKFNLDNAGGMDKYEPNWSTYVGGSGNDGNTSVVLTDLSSDIVFAGQTLSDDLPVVEFADAYFDNDQNTFTDGVLGKLDFGGNLNWLTYFGGDEAINTIYGIETTVENGLIIVGRSHGGAEFPFVNPGGGSPYYTSGKSGFIVELDETLQPVWGTLFGGSDVYYDWLTDVAIDQNRDYIFCGQVSSSGLPTTAGAFQETYSGNQDAYILKIHPDGAYRTKVWCTYYGGYGSEDPTALIADNDNNIFIVGSVNDHDVDDIDAFPRYFAGGCPECFYDDVYSPSGEFESEGFLIKLNDDGNRLWATYFGGTTGNVIRDIAKMGDYIMVTGNLNLDIDEFPLVEVDGVYFDDVNENATSYISMFNKSTELVWSTFLGDNATNGGIALTTDNTHPEVYMVGNISFGTELNDFKPLCDPGGDAFYQDTPLGIATGTDVYKNYDGYILGFDISMFESYISLQNNEDISGLELFPNPTTDIINIITGFEITEVNVFDILGRNIISRQIGSKFCQVDISQFNAGTYLVQVVTRIGTLNKLIVLE